MIVVASGHRPPKLATPLLPAYSVELHDALTSFCVIQLQEIKPERLVTGVALGFDQAAAIAAIQLSIPVIAVLAYPQQYVNWSQIDQARHLKILDDAYKIIYYALDKTPTVWDERDRYMVDRGDSVFALWDGTHNSGTGKSIAYALTQKKSVQNVWQDWVDLNTTKVS